MSSHCCRAAHCFLSLNSAVGLRGIICADARCAGAGVGYATATKLVNAFGTSVLSIMDEADAAQKLSEVGGIGRTNAAKFKRVWDASKGGLGCLLQLSVGGVLAIA